MQFDREGRVPGMAQKKLRQIYPQPGWVEHDPTEISRTAPTAAERRRAANPLETGLRA
jgi:glycerol kinase